MSKEQVAMLKSAIHSIGFTVKSAAMRIGINHVTLYRKMNGEAEFTRGEILALSKLLELTYAERELIFFDCKVA